MLWEHPRIAESLVRTFSSTIPDRSLDDGLLQQVNRGAYERDFSVNSEGLIPERASITYIKAATKLGGLRNYSKEGKNLSLKEFANNAPRLLEPKNFSWNINCGLTEWNVDFSKFKTPPKWKGNSLMGEGTFLYGLLWEGGTSKFMPSDSDFQEWNTWINDDHKQCCNDTEVGCLGFDTRNHIRVRYRAKITPDPFDSAYYNATQGTRIGELYSQESLNAGIISHQLILQADVETTAGDLGWFGLGDEDYTAESIADFGIIINNLTTGDSDEIQLALPAGKSTASYNYAFPKAGLYSIFVYLKSISVNGILVSTPLKENIEDAGGDWIKASHPIRTLVYVSPTPNSFNNYILLEDSEPLPNDTDAETFILKDDAGDEGDDEDDENNLWPVIMFGGLVAAGVMLTR